MIGWEVECPACGALIEAPDEDLLLARASRHCLEAHGYDLPAEHLRASAVRIEHEDPPTR